MLETEKTHWSGKKSVWIKKSMAQTLSQKGICGLDFPGSPKPTCWGLLELFLLTRWQFTAFPQTQMKPLSSPWHNRLPPLHLVAHEVLLHSQQTLWAASATASNSPEAVQKRESWVPKQLSWGWYTFAPLQRLSGILSTMVLWFFHTGMKHLQ